MKIRYQPLRAFAICALLCVLLCSLPGCNGTSEESSAPSAASATPVVTPSPAATAPVPAASPTPVPTTPPDIETAAATATPAATPTDDGRVTLADGFYYVKLNDEIKERIIGISYPADVSDAKITFDELRYVRVCYYDFEGNAHSNGELIVNRKVAQEVMEIFYELYQAKYPFTSIRLVDDFGQPASDTLSMEANNTSAFCYRYVNNSDNLSWHSFGAAVDINPMYNPYINGDRVSPKNSVEYVDRSLGLPGMIDHDDLCYQLFIENGWKWGGDWSDPDYQHFFKALDYDR